MSACAGKRNYIQRKKYLYDCVSQIKTTLDFIRLARGETVQTASSQSEALAHAQAIEAVCWSPHSRLSAESYQKLMSAKTQELCRTILKKSLTSTDVTHLQKLTAMASDQAKTPSPTLPVPILPELHGHSPSPGEFPEIEWSGTFISSFDGFSADFPSLQIESVPCPSGRNETLFGSIFDGFENDMQRHMDFMFM
jgi:hypothetical protein